MGINNHNVANGRLRNALFLGFNDLSILLFEHHITATITFFCGSHKKMNNFKPVL